MPGQTMQPSSSMKNGQTPINLQEASLNLQELSRLSAQMITTLRWEMGIQDKDLNPAPTIEETNHIAHVAQQGSGGGQASTALPTPGAAVVNGTPTLNPAPTTALPEVPPAFLTSEFMQSVAATLDNFDVQALFQPDEGINFEQDFREWFDPDDLDMV